MAVVGVSNVTIKPDRMEDYIELVARPAKALLEKYGTKNVRLLAAVVAGEATGSVVYISETDDFAASGAVLDKLFTEPDGMALMAAVNAGDGPMAGYQLSFWVDIPL
jgi:hypothetical protein